MIFLLTYWKYIVTGALVLAVSYMLHSLDINRIESKAARTLAAQMQFDKAICENSKTAAKEANIYAENNNDKQLNVCLVQLRSQTKCIPVYIARTSNSFNKTCEQPTGGITNSAITASNIECQHDRNDLNAAKIWAYEYMKFKNEANQSGIY